MATRIFLELVMEVSFEAELCHMPEVSTSRNPQAEKLPVIKLVRMLMPVNYCSVNTVTKVGSLDH